MSVSINIRDETFYPFKVTPPPRQSLLRVSTIAYVYFLDRLTLDSWTLVTPRSNRYYSLVSLINQSVTASEWSNILVTLYDSFGMVYLVFSTQ